MEHIDVPEENTAPSEENTETPEESSIKQTFGTGALTERLLPTGILDAGLTDAPVTLLLFTEHNCDYCRQFQSEHFPKLLEEFIAQNKVRYQVITLPLKKYDQSLDAAAGVICAGMQSKGFTMHETLLQRLRSERLRVLDIAKEIGLDMKSYNECLASEKLESLLLEQQSLASSLDVTLVPTIFLNGEKHVGLPYYPDLRGMIEEKLKM